MAGLRKCVGNGVRFRGQKCQILGSKGSDSGVMCGLRKWLGAGATVASHIPNGFADSLLNSLKEA